MIFWLVLGLALLFVLLASARWYANTTTQNAKRAFKLAFGLVGGGLLLVILLRGGISPLISAAVAMAPLLLGLRGAFRRARATQGPSPGGASTVMSAWFEMSLDHDTGEVGGTVRKGPHAGADLDDLDEATLDELARECAGDANSSRLLGAYMARRFGREERYEDDEAAGGDGGSGGADGPMTRAEALQILGLEEGADNAEINAAYKRMIALAHPDKGGSAYLAAKINEARSLLLANG